MFQSKVSQFAQSRIPLSISHISHLNASTAPGFSVTLCPSHPQYPITNMCLTSSCIEPLCPQCIPAHIKLHQKSKEQPKIETIVSARVECIERLAEQKYYIETDLEKIEKEYRQDPEKVVIDLREKLASSRSKLQNLIAKLYLKMEEQIQIVYSASCSQSQRVGLQLRKAATPLSEHLEYISGLKQQMESDDFISTLIELLSDFPKKPQLKALKKSTSLGSVEVNPKVLEQVHKAIQKYVYVVLNCKQDASRLANPKSNSSKFSRLSVDKSRLTDRSKSRERSIFQSKTLGTMSTYGQMKAELQSSDSPFRVVYQPTRSASVSIECSDYFQASGKICYFQQNTKTCYCLSTNYPEEGFSRLELDISFSIPQRHRSLVTPGGLVILLGGMVGGVGISKTFVLEANTLVQVASMNTQRYDFGVCYHQEHIYVAGGIYNEPVAKFQKFNIKKRYWTALRPCIKANFCCQLTAFNHYVAKLGGRDADVVSNTLELYNVQADSWVGVSLGPQFQSPLACGFSQTSQNELIVFGGQVSGQKTNQVNIFRFQGNTVSIRGTVQIYSDCTFTNPCYVIRRTLISLQNTSKGASKNVLRFTGANWKFVSC